MSTTSASYRKGRLIRALFATLRDNPDGLAAKDAIANVRTAIDLHPSEAGTFSSSGEERFPRLIRFATIPPSRQAG